MRGGPVVVREDGTIEVPLTRGQTALVDPVSYAVVHDRKWTAVLHARGNNLYRAEAKGWPDRRTIMMHRLIAKAAPGADVDHINHDTLDNRIENLRLVDRAANQANQSVHRMGTRRRKTSRFKGVHLSGERTAWVAQIAVGGTVRYLGRFRDEESAARAYDAAAEGLSDHAFTNRMAGLL
jgi:hypothetical protein